MCGGGKNGIILKLKEQKEGAKTSVAVLEPSAKTQTIGTNVCGEVLV